MSEPAERYVAAADRFGTTLRGVGVDQWPRPTPCEQWTVRELVVHVVETHRRVLSLIDAPVGGPAAADGDPGPAWDAVTFAVREALADPERAASPVPSRGGTQRFDELVGGLLTIDTLCHAWDLARATGQDEMMPESVVAHAHETLRALDGAIRVPGGFAAAIEPAEGASAQTRFLNFTGRCV
jgi:uncharacterized protein (TIGR03086 family)